MNIRVLQKKPRPGDGAAAPNQPARGEPNIAPKSFVLIPAAIWAITEHHNAGGWPTQGSSQSSGIHDVWNIWIIYPAIAWAFLTTAVGLGVYLRKPISESQIKREMERQAH